MSEAIQGQTLKNLKVKAGFIENVGLNGSTVCFKIGLYKCLKNFPALKSSSLPLHYFRNNFKLIKIDSNSTQSENFQSTR